MNWVMIVDWYRRTGVKDCRDGLHSLYARMRACVRACMRVHIQVCRRCRYVCMCVNRYPHTHTHTGGDGLAGMACNLCTHPCIHTHTHTHTHTRYLFLEESAVVAR